MSEEIRRARGALEEWLGPRLANAAAEWLRNSCLELSRAGDALPRSFAAAGRRCGRGPLVDGADAVRLFASEGPLLNPWDVEDAARVTLLLADAERAPEGATERSVARYFEGAQRERIAVLRGLQLLPESDAGLRATRDALRASAVDLFAAAMCENLHTSRCLIDELFCQGVLKAVFNDLRIDRIERIEERATPELTRMLLAYVSEREKAGRPVAAELWAVMAIHPIEGVGQRIASRLAAAAGDEERRVLAVALERAQR